MARPIEPAHSLLLSTFFLHVYLSAVCVGIAHPLAVWFGLCTSYLPVSLPGCVATWSTTCSELSFQSRTANLPAWAFLIRPRRGLAQSLLPRAAPECAIGLSRCVSAVFSAGLWPFLSSLAPHSGAAPPCAIFLSCCVLLCPRRGL